MPKIHLLWQDQPPSDSTVAADKPLAWCEEHLGELHRFRVKPGRLPAIRPEIINQAYPARFVLLQITQAEGKYKPGYYWTRTTPKDLINKLKMSN